MWLWKRRGVDSRIYSTWSYMHFCLDDRNVFTKCFQTLTLKISQNWNVLSWQQRNREKFLAVIVQFQKIFMLPPQKGLEFPVGGGEGFCTGFVPFFRNKFPGFSSIKGSKIHYTPKIVMSILLSAFHKLHILVEFNRFPELSRTSGLFPGLSSPGKCHNKIPGLSRFSRTRTNPVYTAHGQTNSISDVSKQLLQLF